MLDIVDLEFGVIRTIDSVRALNIVPPPDALTALGIGRGRWVDYHIALWSLSARAQIQRTEDLVQLVRWCDKAEHESGDLRSPDTLAPLEPFKAYIKSIRDPYAHAGGYIEGVAKDGHLERAVLSSLWPDAAELLDGFERWHEKWAKAVAHQHLLLFDAEGLVFEKVDACVQWASWV